MFNECNLKDEYCTRFLIKDWLRKQIGFSRKDMCDQGWSGHWHRANPRKNLAWLPLQLNTIAQARA